MKDQEVNDAFEDLAHALRILLEAYRRAHADGLIEVDRAEAVGNIETGYTAVLNAFHSLYDAMKQRVPKLLDWYARPELATLLVLRNARHHNHANKIRTLYTAYVQETEPIGSMRSYVLVGFPPEEEGTSTFEVYISWKDFEALLGMPETKTKIWPETKEAVEAYLGTSRFRGYAETYELGEDRVFFNVVPLIINGALRVVPVIEPLLVPRSLESKTFISTFTTAKPARTDQHEVQCGPIALLP